MIGIVNISKKAMFNLCLF